MRLTRRAIVFAWSLSLCAAAPCLGQGDPASTIPVFAPDAMERFLRDAEIVATRGTTKGVTNPKRDTLSDGVFRHDAQIQDVDIALPIFDVGPKHTEINNRDTYRYNIAAYRLSRQLGLDNVPMSVDRRWNGKPAAFTWWFDDAIDEGTRQKRKTRDPDPGRTASYLHILRVVDELLQNRDRNAGNLLWTSDGKMWMIDHTRAFRLGKSLREPEKLERVERTLFEKLKALTPQGLAEAAGESLKKDEIEALFERRDLIVSHFEARMASRGEAVVLYTLTP
jgi:hypothetical protein